MYVMGWIFDRNDMKRFNSSYHNLDINTFSYMILLATWNKKGFQERFGCVQFVCLPGHLALDDKHLSPKVHP